ncbi:MAG: hypothetical protein JW730_00060 [Anaerolineales bacterium]|nr:hypothetical protein [Anaerolineales bacterium]
MAQETSARTTSFRPRLADFIFIAVLFNALASGAQMLSIDSDLGRHLTLGNYILDNRIVPTRDLVSHTLSNHPRPPYEWLSQTLFALANRLLGLDGVILLTAVIIAATFTLIFQFANRRSKSPVFAFLITLLAAGASSFHWLPRPHIITFMFLAIWIENLEQLKRGKPIRVFVFPLTMLFWANLHGGFIFGILAWFAYAAGWLWERWQGKANNQTGMALLGTGLLSLPATITTPDLWRNWEAVLNNRSAFILNRTAETMPPDLTDPAILPFTVLLALSILFFLVNRKTLSASHFFLIAGLGGLSLWMARSIPLFAIACAPILSESGGSALLRLNAWSKIEERFREFGKQSLWPVIPLIAVLCTVGYLANRNFNERRSVFAFNPRVFPVQALDWLEDNPQPGNMFNEFNWGGYILYRTWPGQLVFLDSQSDFYGEPLMRDYDQIMTARGDWEDLLGKYQVDWAIIPTHSPFAIEISGDPGWETLYEDETATIIHKSQSSFP